MDFPNCSSEEYDQLFKIVILGDSTVGKSSLLRRFTQNKFKSDCKTTIGVDFNIKNVEIDGKTIKAQIWDTAGQDRFRAITSTFYRGAMGAILVFDITNHETYENLNRWNQELLKYLGPKIQIMLVGNKTDKKHLRTVTTEEASQYAENHQFSYMETSAKDSNNVARAFSTLISNIYWNRQTIQSANQDNSDNSMPDLYTQKRYETKQKPFYSCRNIL